MIFEKDDIYSSLDVSMLVERIHHTPSDFEEGDIELRIDQHPQYQLKFIKVSKLDRGQYQIDEELVEEYAKKDRLGPPIVCGYFDGRHYDVIDGNHRVEAAIKNNIIMLPAFVPYRGK